MIEENKIYNMDNATGMIKIHSGTIDVILTDPPYLYLKNQKLDRPFNENLFFSECKRVLKDNGFIVLFGRGESFYRWNTILANLGFVFKEEIVWDKSYCSSPLMNISRVHETVSIFTKKNGTIKKVKVPYLEAKKNDIDGICQDIRRMKGILKNTKSLDAVLSFLINNKVEPEGNSNANYVTVSSDIHNADRCASVLNSIKNGMNEKTIIRTDYKNCDTIQKYELTGDKNKMTGDRCANVMQSMSCGMNEKSIIKQVGERFKSIHPTQKPIRLLERILSLVSNPGDLILDPFSGSASTAIASYNLGCRFIGFEIDQEYYDKSIERINEVLSTPRQGELFKV